jgi:hypothetical protein
MPPLARRSVQRQQPTATEGWLGASHRDLPVDDGPARRRAEPPWPEVVGVWQLALPSVSVGLVDVCAQPDSDEAVVRALSAVRGARPVVVLALANGEQDRPPYQRVLFTASRGSNNSISKGSSGWSWPLESAKGNARAGVHKPASDPRGTQADVVSRVRAHTVDGPVPVTSIGIARSTCDGERGCHAGSVARGPRIAGEDGDVSRRHGAWRC